jgi:RNA polymerase sigma factor (sigma-70 family)
MRGDALPLGHRTLSRLGLSLTRSRHHGVGGRRATLLSGVSRGEFPNRAADRPGRMRGNSPPAAINLGDLRLLSVGKTSLTRQANQDDRFIGWAREHGQAVRGYLLAMVRRPDLADDLAQEVFCRAWQARSRYREVGNARAYLLRIADRLVCDRRRKSGRERTLDEESWKQIEPVSRVVEASEALARAEAASRLTEALDRLSPAQRRVLLLRYYGQMSFAEIAEIVDCPLSTALSHCRRGLLALRKLMVGNVL